MAHLQGVRAKILVQPPRGLVIFTLTMLSWALFWAAGNVISGSFRFIAGV